MSSFLSVFLSSFCPCLLPRAQEFRFLLPCLPPLHWRLAKFLHEQPPLYTATAVHRTQAGTGTQTETQPETQPETETETQPETQRERQTGTETVAESRNGPGHSLVEEQSESEWQGGRGGRGWLVLLLMVVVHVAGAGYLCCFHQAGGERAFRALRLDIARGVWVTDCMCVCL
jgi:hypothetical protein